MCQNISMERFSDWLLKELQQRNITQAHLATIAGLGSGTISNIMSGNRKVGTGTLEKIAKALNIPVDEVFQAAGLLPGIKRAREVLTDRFAEVLSELPDDDIDDLYNLALSKLERHQKNKK